MMVNDNDVDLAIDYKPRVLIVEDSDVYQSVYLHYLKHHNIFDVSVAKDGGEALLRVEHSLREPGDRFDLIFLDHYLPDTTGMEVLKEIRRMEKTLKVHWESYIIISTICSDLQLSLKMIMHGANDYLNKPISEEDFKVALESYSDLLNVEC